MKFPAPRILYITLISLFPLLPGCSELEGQIIVLKDRIATSRQNNSAMDSELLKMKQELALATRKINDEAAKKKDYETKTAKSSATERTLVKYREALETSLSEFSNAVAEYRGKYLVP